MTATQHDDMSWADLLPDDVGGHDALAVEPPARSTDEVPPPANRAERRAAGERGPATPRSHRGKVAAGGGLVLLIAGLAVAQFAALPVAIAAAAGVGAAGAAGGGAYAVKKWRKRRPKTQGSRALRQATRQAQRAVRSAMKPTRSGSGSGRSKLFGSGSGGRKSKTGSGSAGSKLPKFGGSSTRGRAGSNRGRSVASRMGMGAPAASRGRRAGVGAAGIGRPGGRVNAGRKSGGGLFGKSGSGRSGLLGGGRSAGFGGGRSRSGRAGGVGNRRGGTSRRRAASAFRSGAAMSSNPITNRRLRRASRIAKAAGLGKTGRLGTPATMRQRRAARLLGKHQHRMQHLSRRWKAKQRMREMRWTARQKRREQRRKARAARWKDRRARLASYRPRWWRILAAYGWKTAMAAAAAGLVALIRQVPGWVWAPKTATEKAAPATTKTTDTTPAARPAMKAPARPNRPAAPKTTPVQHPGAAPAVPRPRRTTKGPTPVFETMHPSCQAAVDAFRESIGGYQMPDQQAVPDVDHFLGSFQEMFAELAVVMRGLADQFDSDTPVEHEVAEYMREVADGQHNMGDGAAEVYQTWRDVNAPDIERHENPRPHETAFNV